MSTTVTFLHSCGCGEPIVCQGDEVNMFGIIVCTHFHCESCTLKSFGARSWDGHTEVFMHQSIHDGYNQRFQYRATPRMSLDEQRDLGMHNSRTANDGPGDYVWDDYLGEDPQPVQD